MDMEMTNHFFTQNYVEYKSFEKSKKNQEFIFDGNCITVEKGDYIIHLGHIIKNSKFE